MFDVSQRRACDVLGADQTMVWYRSRRSDDGAIRKRIRGLAAERRRFGYRRSHWLAAAARGRDDRPREVPAAVPRETLARASPQRLQTGAWHAGADDDPAGTQPALVARLCIGRVFLWSSVPHVVVVDDFTRERARLIAVGLLARS